jgi:ribonuclease D
MADLEEALEERLRNLVAAFDQKRSQLFLLSAEITKLRSRIRAERAIQALRPSSQSVPRGSDDRLVEGLHKLRRRIARELGVRPFGVFDDRTLNEIAERQPATEFELLKINGISTERLKRYGDEVVAFMVRFKNPKAILPDRPFFARCSFCNALQALFAEPAAEQKYHCNRCASSTDPRLKRSGITVKLPTAKDFD